MASTEPLGPQPLPEPDAHDGTTHVASGGARILAYASYNLEDQSLDDFAATSLPRRRYARVTYRKRGKDFLAVSDLRDIAGRESVFYGRYYLPPNGETVRARNAGTICYFQNLFRYGPSPFPQPAAEEAARPPNLPLVSTAAAARPHAAGALDASQRVDS